MLPPMPGRKAQVRAGMEATTWTRVRPTGTAGSNCVEGPSDPSPDRLGARDAVCRRFLLGKHLLDEKYHESREFGKEFVHGCAAARKLPFPPV